MIATVVLALRIAMAIALYAFLGWALLILWQELKQQANILASQKTPGINLDVITGQDQTIQKRFAENEILIGRDKNCDLPLTDDAISAHHARMTYHHGQWWLEDSNSSNGTFLNREKLNTPAVITTGDEFKCGDTVFRVRIEADDILSPTKELQTGGPS